MIRAALFHGEPAVRNELRGMLRKSSCAVETAEYESFETLLWDVETGQARYDLYILDICSDGLKGLAMARQLQTFDENVGMIFLSDRGEFYQETQEVGALGCLTYPVQEQTLLALVEKLALHIRRRRRRIVTVTYRSSTYVMRFEDIEYISSTNHTLHFHLRSGEERICYERLDAVLPRLDPGLFVRCHQSHVVNLDYVVEHTPKSFRMTSNTVVPISRSYTVQAKEGLEQYLFDRTERVFA